MHYSFPALSTLYAELAPADAEVLKKRVAALTDQRKRLQIDDPTYSAALKALGLDARYINALRAAADSMITPKLSAFAIPVSTS